MRQSSWRINFDLSHMVAAAGSLQEFCKKPAMLQVLICAVTKQGMDDVWERDKIFTQEDAVQYDGANKIR